MVHVPHPIPKLKILVAPLVYAIYNVQSEFRVQSLRVFIFLVFKQTLTSADVYRFDIILHLRSNCDIGLRLSMSPRLSKIC